MVDLSADFLDAAETNATAFTQEAIVSYLHVLAPNGIVSIPVSIRDFPVYALRMLATVRAALLTAGIDDPADHVIVYRSAWNVRILVLAGWLERGGDRPRRASSATIVRSTCPGIPGWTWRRLGPASTTTCPRFPSTRARLNPAGRTMRSPMKRRRFCRASTTPSREQFNLSPITLDKPFFYAVLRLDQIGTILKRLEILPQTEVGGLVNLAVLAQAVIIAALVLLVPLAAPGRIRAPQTGVWRSVVYFPALALGFLFIEIYLIEKASFWLGDRTNGFALVLTGMLVFSGLGSLLSDAVRRPAATRHHDGRRWSFWHGARLCCCSWSR